MISLSEILTWNLILHSLKNYYQEKINVSLHRVELLLQKKTKMFYLQKIPGRFTNHSHFIHQKRGIFISSNTFPKCIIKHQFSLSYKTFKTIIFYNPGHFIFQFA